MPNLLLVDLQLSLEPATKDDPEGAYIVSALSSIVVDNAKSPAFSRTKASAHSTVPGLMRLSLKDCRRLNRRLKGASLLPCRWNDISRKSSPKPLSVPSQQALKMPVRTSTDDLIPPSLRTNRISPCPCDALKMPVRSLDRDEHDDGRSAMPPIYKKQERRSKSLNSTENRRCQEEES